MSPASYQTAPPRITMLANRPEPSVGVDTLRDMDMKLELVNVPVSDVDRAKAFYVDQVGFHLDNDAVVTEGLRFIQLTPPGSMCSISIGTGLTDGAPGSSRGLQLVVQDAQGAHDE